MCKKHDLYFFSISIAHQLGEQSSNTFQNLDFNCMCIYRKATSMAT